MKTSIASLFGLTQREMAMALGIGLSQWSMYESGKRNLPVRAQHLLNEMTAHVNAAKASAKKSIEPSLNENRIAYVKSLLVENEFRQKILMRKIAAEAKKVTAVQQYMFFDDFLKKYKADNKKTGLAPVFVETHKKHLKVQANDNDLLFQYELKLQVLIEEQKLFEARLSSLGNGPSKA